MEQYPVRQLIAPMAHGQRSAGRSGLMLFTRAYTDFPSAMAKPAMTRGSITAVKRKMAIFHL